VPTITVDGTPIHYQETGTGNRIVCLIHGSGGSTAVWIRQLEGLADLARVIALDLPGHGQSGGSGIGTIAEAAMVVHGLLSAIGVTSAVVGGHSMGGAVAQAYALAHPDRLAGLVLVGTGARLRVLPTIFERLEKDYAEGVMFVTRLAVSREAPPELVASLAQQTLTTPRSVFVGDFRACDVFDVMDRIGTVRAPTLAICGAEDQLTPPKYSALFANRIVGARVVVVEGAGHYVQLERPDETTEAIRAFVTSLPEPG
jgi:pimeloyl-ACP methyl ester carboxylesterase